MMLYLNGSDIAHLTLGCKENEGTWQFESFDVSPEQFLKTIDGFLHAQQKSIEDVESIFIVVGPGSATSLRASISIANTWHFVRKIALHGIEKTAEQSDEDALNTYTQKEQGSAEHQIYLEPKYSQGPQITASNKDQLGRPMASNS